MTTPYICECQRDESRGICGRPNALPYRVPLDGKNVVTHLCADCALFMGARPPYECEQDRVARADRQKELEHYKRRAEDAERALVDVVLTFDQNSEPLGRATGDSIRFQFLESKIEDARAVLARVPATLPPSVIASMPKVAPGVTTVPDREVVRVTLPGREEAK